MHYPIEPQEDSWRTKDYSYSKERFYVPAQRKPETIRCRWNILYHISTAPSLPLIIPFLAQRIILDTKGTKANHKKAGLYALNIVLGALFGSLFYYIQSIELIAMAVLWTILSCIFARKAIMETVANNHARTHAQESMRQLLPLGNREVPLEYQHERIYGDPGKIGNEVIKCGEKNAQAGNNGELKTARMLDDLVRIPGTRVFHGVKLPGSESVDIDHIAVNGDKIVLIDSKMWSGIEHRLDGKGEVTTTTQSGSFYSRGVMKLPNAVAAMSELYPGYTVTGMIAIHAPDGSIPAISKDDKIPQSDILIADAELAVESIAAWFSQDNPAIVDMGLLKNIKSYLK